MIARKDKKLLNAIMNQQLTLRELNENDEQAFLAGCEDWKKEELTWYSFVWKPGLSHSEHLQLLQDQKDKSKLRPGLVPSTMLYGFVNGEIVGRFNVRHELNQHLFERGGNVGYSVNPRHRNKGYATEMFRQGIIFCKQLGLDKVLITCADQNTASWNIIERFGGSLENRFLDKDENEFVRRYWVNSDLEKFNPSQVSHKAVAYITRVKNFKTQLLVFEHDAKYLDAGIQVPCGTVDPGENPLDTVKREVLEESGLQDVNVECELDQYQFFSEHVKKFHRRHVFHISLNSTKPDRWSHQVIGDGADNGLNFHYTWLDLDSVKGKLSARFDDSIDLLKLKIQNN